MRPAAFKNIAYNINNTNAIKEPIPREDFSFIILYIDLLCLAFLSISILSTHQRLLDFFNDYHKSLPKFTSLLLNISSYEYMTAATTAGIFLVIKERMKNKNMAFFINIAALLMVWFVIFSYIWGISLPFKH